MSDAKSPSDLSMEEILTAIRRIIADDEQSNAAAGTGRAGGEAAESAAAATAASGGDSSPLARAGAEADVLELTEALNEDGTVRRLAPIGGSAPYLAGASREPPGPAAAVPEPGPEQQAQPEPEPVRREPSGALPTVGAVQPEGSLVSEVTSLAAAAAFARLAGAPRTHRETPMVGDKPLDQIVQDLLRPLLQTWLDENLPQIVERLVQAEIARIGRSETGETG
jgi:uncharacterized protein